MRLGGREILPPQIARIRSLISTNPKATRSEIAAKVCREFQWRRPNGELRTRSCQDLLNRLSESGRIALPPSRQRVARRTRPRFAEQENRDLPSEETNPIDVALSSVTVRPIEPSEMARWRELMARHHYLGDGGIVGETIRHVAESSGRWLALLGWGAAALKSRHREAWISWDEKTKLQRLHFVTDNVRFLVLPWARIKGLASSVLSKSLRRLSGDFETRYQHPVLLAETFIDLSRFRGTCYRAANWICLGETRGVGRKGRGFEPHGKKKSIFVFPLQRRTREILAAPLSSPELLRKPTMPAISVDVNRLPLEGRGGLIEVLRSIADPRCREGIRYPYASVLALAVMGALSGMRSYEALAEWAKDLPKDLLRRMKCWCHKAPSEPTFRRILQSANAAEIDARVGAWLAKQSIGGAIALDGKTLRGSRDGAKPACHLLSAITHTDGVVVGQQKVDEKSNEITGAVPLLEGLDIEGETVTADAMHTQRSFASYVVEEKKADYVLIAKENQPNLLADIEAVDWKSIPPSGPNVGQGTRQDRESGDPGQR